MSSESNTSTSEFALLERKGDGPWTAIKRTNPDETDLYIALPWSNFDVPIPNDPYQDQPDEGLVARLEVLSWVHVHSLVLRDTDVVYRIFNHKNIVSIAGSIEADSHEAAASANTGPTDYLVWDHCAHSDLTARIRALRESPDETIKESFCWHVLTSLLEAITYLHDGRRLVEEGGQRLWKAESVTWTPILHGKIEPQNVLFQKTGQDEEHDRCKLADLRWAVALNHKISYYEGERDELDEDGGSAASRLERLEETLSLDACVPKWQNPHGHSIDSELYTLGRLIYSMMTDDIHETNTGYCMHELEGKYSEQLAAVVKFLLDRRLYLTRFAEQRVERVLPMTKVVMEYYREWKMVNDS